MSGIVYPHSHLIVGAQKTVDITGPHIQVLETSSGKILYTTTAFSESDKAKIIKSGPVRCIAVNKEFRYLLTSGEDKMLKVWDLEGLVLVNEREMPKKPTGVAFTADGQTLVVSDKFGDVFSYPFVYTPPTEKPTRTRDALSSHENPSGGTLILGHTSPVHAFILTPDEKYIVTADRDEHIRVSWFPKGYVIERYCLGHLRFVSAIHIPPSAPSRLISGGGEPTLKVWDWMEGKIMFEVPILDVVEPTIVVRAFKGQKRWYDDDERGQGKKGKGKKGRAKGKGKAKDEDEDEEEDEVEEEGQNMDVDPPKPDKILVVKKVESVDDFVLFSVVGSTALFAFPFKEDAEIVSFDFGRPLLDFAVASDGGVLVSLDSRWTPRSIDLSVPETEDLSLVRAVKIVSGQLVESSGEYSGLLGSLNNAALVPASREEVKALDLYGDLLSMPKYTAVSEARAEGAELAELRISPIPFQASKQKKVTRKDMGKRKAREVVEKLESERESKRTRS